PIDVGSPSVEPLLSVSKSDQAKISSFSNESLEDKAIVIHVASKKKKSDVPRRMSVSGSFPSLSATISKGKHPWVLARFIRNLARNSDSLSPKIESVKLEKAKLVRDFLPLAFKKLFESEHFNQVLGDLQQKAITYSRSEALDEFHEDHLAKFHKITAAKEMWEAIKSRFGGNDEAKDNGRRRAKHDKPKAMVTIDGDGVDWTGHAEDDIKNYALMAFNSSNSGSDTKKLKTKKEELKTKLKIFQSSSKGLSKLLNNQMSAKDKSRLSRSSDVEDSPVNDRFAKV
nr:hypothetical protein [Tanacetum cinerariifolium]